MDDMLQLNAWKVLEVMQFRIFWGVYSPEVYREVFV